MRSCPTGQERQKGHRFRARECPVCPCPLSTKRFELTVGQNDGCLNFVDENDEVLISGFGRSGKAKGDIPGVRFKVVKVSGVGLLALWKEKKVDFPPAAGFRSVVDPPPFAGKAKVVNTVFDSLLAARCPVVCTLTALNPVIPDENTIWNVRNPM